MSVFRINHPVHHTVSPGVRGYPDDLIITANGEITPGRYGRPGVYVASGLTGIRIVNHGTITGSDGGDDYDSRHPTGGGAGVYLNAGSLENFGTITGGVGARLGNLQTAGIGVEVRGGSVNNHGVITGGYGGTANAYIVGAGWGGTGVELIGGALNNSGAIEGGAGRTLGFFNSYDLTYGGKGGVGVYIRDGGNISNKGLIQGGEGGNTLVSNHDYTSGGTGGVGVHLDDSRMTNIGTIYGGAGGNSRDNSNIGPAARGGTGGQGAYLYNSTLLNRGVINGGAGGAGQATENSPKSSYYGGVGGVGVYLYGGTLTNAGTIKGGAGGVDTGSNSNLAPNGDAVKFGTIASTLIIDPGAVFDGDVVANSSVDDVLELGGATPGTLSGLGMEITGFTSVGVATDADWTLVDSGSLGATTSLSDSGQLLISGSITFDGSVSGSGTLGLAANAVVIAAGTLGIAGVSFATDGALDVYQPGSFSSTISGFSTGDTIDLSDVTTTSLGYGDGTLTLYDNGSAVDELKFSGSYTIANFTHMPDDHGGTTIGFLSR